MTDHLIAETLSENKVSIPKEVRYDRKALKLSMEEIQLVSIPKEVRYDGLCAETLSPSRR